MRNYLLNGHTEIFGAGKGIIRSFQDFDLCAEPYMKHPKNTIYYFGDLDYEGIGIYENLAEKFRSRWKTPSLCRHIRLCLEKQNR